MNWNLEVLSAAQDNALLVLRGAILHDDLYLAGGAAAGLRFGHRRTEDLDWFSPHELGDPLGVAARLKAHGVPFEITSMARGTLYGRVMGVTISILEYPYPVLEQPEEGPGGGFRVAKLDDLAAMKLAAVVSRGARKDFLDIWALGTRHKPLRELIETYRSRYGIRDLVHLFRALVYFDDAEREPMPMMLWDVEWKQIRNDIEGWVVEMANEPLA